MGLTHVTDADFEQQVLKSDKPVLVDFWAEWCQPCQMIAPIVEQVADQYKDELSVAKLDVDTNQRTAMTYGVQSIPTLLIFKDGKEVKRLVGFMPKDRLAGEVQRVIEVVATA
ncbi:MAG TPA: thioredoxin [Chloroflexota bacterium]|jgi:thioredoxin 1|nr:thioredoxin [Chloroflexota bacterium]